MAKRKTRRGNPKYNWPAILAAAVLVSAFLIIYLATGNKISFAWENGELTELSVTVGFGETVSLAFNGDVCTLHGRVGETVKLI